MLGQNQCSIQKYGTVKTILTLLALMSLHWQQQHVCSQDTLHSKSHGAYQLQIMMQYHDLTFSLGLYFQF